MNTDAINEAALEYAKKHSAAPDKETPDWIITDFKAGAKWMAEQFKAEQKQTIVTDYPKPSWGDSVTHNLELKEP